MKVFLHNPIVSHYSKMFDFKLNYNNSFYSNYLNQKILKIQSYLDLDTFNQFLSTSSSHTWSAFTVSSAFAKF